MPFSRLLDAPPAESSKQLEMKANLTPLQRNADGLCDELFEGASLQADLRAAGFTLEECLEAGLSPEEERVLQEADELHTTGLERKPAQSERGGEARAEPVVLGINVWSLTGGLYSIGRGGAMPIAAPSHPQIQIAPARSSRWWTCTGRAASPVQPHQCAGILLVKAMQAALFVWIAGSLLFFAVRLGRALLVSISRGDYALAGGGAGDAGAWSQAVVSALGGAAACSVFVFVVGWALADYRHGRCATWGIGEWAIAAFVVLQGLAFLGVGVYFGLLATLLSDALPHIKASGMALWGLLLIAAASRPWRLFGRPDWPCCTNGTLLVLSSGGAGPVGGGSGGGGI